MHALVSSLLLSIPDNDVDDRHLSWNYRLPLSGPPSARVRKFVLPCNFRGMVVVPERADLDADHSGVSWAFPRSTHWIVTLNVNGRLIYFWANFYIPLTLTVTIVISYIHTCKTPYPARRAKHHIPREAFEIIQRRVWWATQRPSRYIAQIF